MNPVRISVIIPTHSPKLERLERTLHALSQQTFTTEKWELILVDNASSQPLTTEQARAGHPAARVILETQLGLTNARLAGISSARGEILVFVDDDNVLDHNYLTETWQLFHEHPNVAAAGGIIQGEYEIPPPAWATDYLWSLAIRDFGEQFLVSSFTAQGEGHEWPVFSPVGAGLAVRAEATRRYVDHCKGAQCALSDRRGSSLGSAGDCELVMHAAFLAGAQVAYSAKLRITHLIPRGRLSYGYFVRLGYEGGVTWGEFLTTYGFKNQISCVSLLLRVPRVFWRMKGWTRHGFVAFCSAAGEFVGRASRR